MPWSETCAMDERMRFVIAASEDDAEMSAVCAEFGISRPTGYKWLARYAAEGLEGLKERSRGFTGTHAYFPIFLRLAGGRRRRPAPGGGRSLIA